MSKSKNTDDFDARLNAALEATEPKPRPAAVASSAKGMGIGMHIAIEIIVATCAGFGLGLLLDNLFGTTPWLMLLGFFLGIGAAFSNAIRASKKYDADIKAKRAAQSESQQPVATDAWSDEDEEEPWLYKTENSKTERANG